MSTKSNPRKDLNETAFSIMQQATDETTPPKKAKAQQEGGLKGAINPAKAVSETSEEESRKKENRQIGGFCF